MKNAPWVESDLESRLSHNFHKSNPVLPAEGIRVLDLTRVVAGPTCSQLLACLGAEVLRIDPPFLPEITEQFISNGMGKKSAVIDFSRDMNLVHELISQADVIIIGYSPGSLDKFGLGIQQLRDDYPGLLIASLSAWGESGPWATRAGFDSIVQAATGISEICSVINSVGERIPGALPVQALDHSTGFILAARILESLAYLKSGIIRTSLVGAAQELTNHKSNGFHEGENDVVTTHHKLSIVDSAYGRLSIPSIPVTIDGDHLIGKVQNYGSHVATWFVE